MINQKVGSVMQFDREYFERVLPVRKTDKTPLWVGYKQRGEHEYRIQMDDPNDVEIIVRSSVSSVTNLSDDSGNNSIRVWLVDSDGEPLMRKLTKYIKRLPDWEGRLFKTLTKLRALRMFAGNCQSCGQPKRIYRAGSGPNEGRWFANCWCTESNWAFTWIPEDMI